MRRSGTRKLLKAGLSARRACVLKNFKRPSPCALVSIARNFPRKRRASTFTCTRKFERDEIHLLPSSDSPPPGRTRSGQRGHADAEGDVPRRVDGPYRTFHEGRRGHYHA